MNNYILAVVLSLFALSLLTRVLPFMFTARLSGNVKMQVLGKRLSSYIMMLLVIYEVNPASLKTYPFALPALFSLLVVTLTHLFLHKPLLSMICGTVSFILLQKWLG
jgi:branched-subunit amino acid transport protein AzlD